MTPYLACVYLRDFQLATALRCAPAQAKGVAVLLDQTGAHARVIATGERCQDAGVIAGMSEQEARALFPACYVLSNDPCAVEEASLALLTDFEGFSPSIEWLGTGIALLDLGVLPSTAKARAIASRMIALLTLRGYQVCIGLAQTRFVAHVAAQVAVAGTCMLVPAREQSNFLAGQPLCCLPAPAETLRRLDLLGMRTLGDLAKLPVNALVDQFGALGVRLAALVRGEDTQPMNAIKTQETLTMSLDCDDPIAGGEPLLQILQGLLDQLFTRLRERGQLATRLRLIFALEGVPEPHQLVLAFAAPHRDRERLWDPLKRRLEALRIPQLICALTVNLEGLVGEYARQLLFDSLFPKQRRWQGIERVMERLRMKEDPPCLLRVVWDAPKAPIPERRAHLQDRVLPKRTRGLYLPKAVQVAVNAKAIPCHVRAGAQWVAVDRVLETWEVEDDWWTARPLLRTYYRVMLHNGSILRLFHDGVNGNWYRQHVC